MLCREDRKFSYRFATLGCKVNQADTYELETELNQRGWSVAKDDPEIYVVNTCAVTGVSEGKSRRLIRRLIRENPHSRLVVTGCYASRNPVEVTENLRPGLDLIVPQKDKNHLPELLAKQRQGSVPIMDKDWKASGASHCVHRTRAFLKIQDGCANFCSYCIVPSLRGKPQSKSLHEVLEEAKELVRQGYQEIVLVGINLGNHHNLTGLLGELVLIGGLARIRLSSLEVNHITDGLLSLMRTNPKICPHLHIPLQSGSDRILARMNRRYTVEQYLKKIDEIRKSLDNPGITTDIIVGFPGETDRDFQETHLVFKKAGFSKIHIFPYSPRPGTQAARLRQTERVPAKVVKERSQQLNQLQRQLALGYKKQFVGKDVTILLEGKGDSGFTPQYLKVRLKQKYPDKINYLVRVLINQATDECLESNIERNYEIE